MMLLMGPIKVSAVMSTCALTAWGQIPLMAEVFRLPIDLGWRIAVSCLHEIERSSLVVLLILAVLDLVMQRWLIYRSLRMDIQEQKQEYKDDNGDPHTNQNRKSVHKELLNESPQNAAAKANAVVVNPQHIAVALSYDFSATTLPMILSKCHDADAKKLRDFAFKNGIPIIKYVGLARKLYAVGKDGGFVPRESLREVALLYRLVQELDQKNATDTVRDIYEIDDEMAHQMLN
jgi:flagellar biosynthesis protein FlhB